MYFLQPWWSGLHLLPKKEIAMRGEQIFKKLVTENDDSLSRKGRNAELLALRNKCLEARYFYYAYHKKKYNIYKCSEILQR